MTDLQLAILLRQYHQRLTGAIEQLENLLPDDMKQVAHNRLIPSLSPAESYPATSELWDMARDLYGSVGKLERSNG